MQLLGPVSPKKHSFNSTHGFLFNSPLADLLFKPGYKSGEILLTQNTGKLGPVIIHQAHPLHLYIINQPAILVAFELVINRGLNTLTDQITINDSLIPL